ncbi:MAG: ATP-binding protein, partial [Myxococcota bacterium]|nr:ATP-binding protein [Myxococcota bacterium]
TWLLFTMQMDVGVLPLFYPLFAVIYGGTVIFAHRLEQIPSTTTFSYAQFLIDVICITVVVAFTGSSESLFVYTYIFVILAAGLILQTRGALTVATLVTVCYVGVLALGLFGYESIRVGLGENLAYQDAGVLYRVSQVIVQLMGFYLIAWLAGTLATRLEESQQALRRAGVDLAVLRELHANIIENIGSGILTVGENGRLSSFNRAASLITGMTVAEALGQHLDDILPGASVYLETPETEPADADDTAAAWVADSQTWEAHVRLPSGERRYLRHAVSTLRDRFGVPVGKIIIFDDESKVRAMEEQMERDRHLAQVGKLAAAIVHEIRNPLAAISGSAQLLGTDEDVAEEDRRLTDIIVREADRLNGLVSNFLGLARNRPLEAGIVLVDECISETLDLLEQDGRQGLEIEREFTFRPGIRADRDRLRQVFWNLFNNAFEAMPEGGRLRVITDRAPGLDERGREILRIQIADTGDGIPASDVEQIFDPFYTRRSGGTGLGLAITRQIVSDHGGRISVSSTPGDGATFEILLPVAEGVARVGSERSVVVG